MKLRTLLISGAAAALMSVSCFAQDINVSLNGTIINFSNQKPVVVDGRTLIPLRGVFDNMGYSIGWNGNTKTVTLKNADKTIVIKIGEDKYYLNGSAHTIDVPAQIINGSTMLPLRAIADATGADVVWDAKTKIATIIDAGTVPKDAPQGMVNVSSQQESDYITNYSEIMSEYNEMALSFINTVQQVKSAASSDAGQMESLYNASKAMYDTSKTSKQRINALSCPDRFRELNSSTAAYMQSISEIAKLYMDIMDDKITPEQFQESLNSMITDMALKEAEYRRIFDEIIKSNS